ncbi:Copper amine oxidase N-terminal domain-containing protein [Thermosyntropha lipolytica DSM 11003]|uniref:Copper amine oxidase N-terminal domain-containing protein n=1 Tax=Thermosyntropha lipolytica DSM 11003 TaxID=1123382 RepID=A0A1M5NZB3_9FIRM|nr:copper amine oxidase N-terminal domain-containing protein [Thermosyntropha lipolytica]SHG94795.1 Copper amine oxidase N-terminal domain-containing protein [Thermosyntropha lipolytica DSM 11003]
MKKRWIVMVAIMMLLAFTAGAVAGSTSQVIQATLAHDFKFMLNGKAWTPQIDGKNLSPIVYEGRTYLPARPLAEALGVKIDWDKSTKTVIIGEAPVVVEEPKPEPKPEPQPEQPKEEPKEEAPAIASADDAAKAIVKAFAPVNAKISISGLVAGMVKVGAEATASIAADGKANANIKGDAGPLGQSDVNAPLCPYSELIYGPEGEALKVVAGAAFADKGDVYVITVTGNTPASLLNMLNKVNDKATWSEVKGTAEITVDKKTNRVTKIIIKNGTAKVKTMLGEKEATFEATFTYSY